MSYDAPLCPATFGYLLSGFIEDNGLPGSENCDLSTFKIARITFRLLTSVKSKLWPFGPRGRVLMWLYAWDYGEQADAMVFADLAKNECVYWEA